MDLKIEGLRVVVTAGASGIGLATARAFAREGARVFLCDIDRDALAAVAGSDPAFGQIECDVADAAAVDRLFAAATSTLGGLDALVNNAGIAGPTAACEDIAPSDWERTLAVNLTGQFLCARRAIALLKASDNASIANLSSAAGRLGFPMRTPYAAAKWGVIGLTKSLSIELGPFGVRVNAIMPRLGGGPAHRPRLCPQGGGTRCDARRRAGRGARKDLAPPARHRRRHRQRHRVSRLAVRRQHLRAGAADRRRYARARLTEVSMPKHPFDLTGKIAVVTGAYRGLGFAIARGLGEAGATVVLNGRKPEPLAEAVKALADLGLRASTSVFDVANREAVRAGIGAIEREQGRVDILVNNAGIQRRNALVDFSQQDWDDVIATKPHRALPRRAGSTAGNDCPQERQDHQHRVAHERARPADRRAVHRGKRGRAAADARDGGRARPRTTSR